MGDVSLDLGYDEMVVLGKWLEAHPDVDTYIWENPWRNEWHVGMSSEDYRAYQWDTGLVSPKHYGSFASYISWKYRERERIRIGHEKLRSLVTDYYSGHPH